MLTHHPMIAITLTYLTALEPETYIVGGAVRNFLMGLPFSDIDITTKMRPDEIIEAFHGYNLDTLGKSFGNIKVEIDDQLVSITTFRKDEYTKSHRYPSQISFVDTLLEDLQRRDFIVNTLCYHSEKGIVDLLDARKDLDRMLLNTVKDAELSFSEDALRMLRALRFICEYDFDLSSEIQVAIQHQYQLIDTLSYRQTIEEVEKIRKGEYYREKRSQYSEIFRLLSR